MANRRAAWWIGAWTAAAVMFAVQASDDEPETVAVAESTISTEVALEVEYGGCGRVRLGPIPRCIVEAGAPLRLWIALHDSRQVMVRVDGDPWPAIEYLAEGMEGFGLEVQLPVGAEELVVETGKTRRPWSLALRVTKDLEATREGPSSDDVDQALGLAFGLGYGGEHRAALETLAKIEDLAQRYPKGRADLETYRGLVYWRQGRFHDAATSLRAGVTFAMRLRDPELIRDALPTYANFIAELGYVDAAADWSDHILTLARARPELFSCREMGKLLSTLGYNHLLVAARRGDAPPSAAPLLEEALEWVGPQGRCPQPESVPGILLSLANAKLAGGDPSGAVEVLADASLLRPPTADQQLRLEDAYLRARLQLGWSPTGFEESLRRLEEAVLGARTPEGRWRLQLRRGDVWILEGRRREAAEAYALAEEQAQQIAVLAAVGVGRETAVSQHGQSTERLVLLLSELGRPAEALCIAREAEARRIQSVGRRLQPEEQRALDQAMERYAQSRWEIDDAMLDGRLLPRREGRDLLRDSETKNERLLQVANEILRAQSTWRPSCEELAPRRPGELMLGLYPAQEGWFVFVQDDIGTDMRWLAGGPNHALDDVELGQELLDPVGARLDAARSVRVLASGVAHGVDVHLLQWKGQRLVEHLPVAYGAELPSQANFQMEQDVVPRALVVGDPTGTLPTARGEALLAGSWLMLQGWELDMPRAVDPQTAVVGLEQASFFYYAGHAEHYGGEDRVHMLPPYPGGTRTWPAHIRLEPPTTLGMQDILMLRAGPRYVALLGCETGVSSGSGGGMSLALAFLVAGAEQVVAAQAKVEDASGFITGLGLLGGVRGQHVDLVQGLRGVQMRALRRGQDVGRYRVWVRG